MTCKVTGNQTLVRVTLPTANHTCPAGSGTPTINTSFLSEFSAVACVYGLTPPGINYDTETDDECLGDAGAPATDLGTQQADTIEITVAFCPGATAGFAAGESVYQWFYERAFNGDELIFQLAYAPNATSGGKEIHYFFCGKIQTIKPDAIEKRTFMRAPITILRTSDVLVQLEP